ncbi:MAG: hypothetical protein V3U50_06955 [Acidimicrobiia bacterium]
MRRRVALHLAVLIVGAAVVRVGVVPAEVCPAVTAANVSDSIDATLGWLIGGMADDGTYTYGYHRDQDRINTSYNNARHGGVTMSLYQAFAISGDRAVLAAADQGLAHSLTSIVEHDDWMAWQPGRNIEVGANGLLLAALALRRAATGDPVHDQLMRAMGRFLMMQQQLDGSVFASWDGSDQQPRPVFGPFATGEAAWALALLDREFPGEGFGEAASLTVDYMGNDRNLAEGYLTSLPDHWAAYTVSDLDSELLTDGRIAYARRLAGYFGIRLRFEAQRRGTGLNLWLRWYPGPPAGVGTAGEGIGALHRLSLREPRLADLTAQIEERLVCTAGFMVQRQVSPEEASVAAEPALQAGAWFYRGYTQMDGQQHVLSALLAALPVLQEMEEDR